MLSALKSNQTLKRLNVSHHDFHNYSSFASVETFLSSNRCLEELNLNNCKLEKYGAKIIGKGLKKNSSLKNLYLSGN